MNSFLWTTTLQTKDSTEVIFPVYFSLVTIIWWFVWTVDTQRLILEIQSRPALWGIRIHPGIPKWVSKKNLDGDYNFSSKTKMLPIEF